MKTQDLPLAPDHATAFEPKRILVPLDFSPLSHNALQYASVLARQADASITIVHVIEPEIPPSYEGLIMAPPNISMNGGINVEKNLKTVVKELRVQTELKVNGNIRRGFAAQEIVDAAKEFDVDLIVIATHGYTGWKHFCIGSTAERVVRAAPCPVLVVREKEREFC